MFPYCLLCKIIFIYFLTTFQQTLIPFPISSFFLQVLLSRFTLLLVTTQNSKVLDCCITIAVRPCVNI